MARFSKYTIFLLTLSLICSGLVTPSYNRPEDRGKSLVNLITSLRSFASASVESQFFKSEFKKAIHRIKTTAGLEHTLEPNKVHYNLSNSLLIYLEPKYTAPLGCIRYSTITEISNPFPTVSPPPPQPPPKIAAETVV
jgi:hypothetical protein